MKTIIRVNGMHCVMCARAIESALGKLAGMEQVSVNVNTGKVSLEYNETALNMENIALAVRETGYEYAGEDHYSSQPRENDAASLNKQRLRMGLGIVTGIFLMIWGHISQSDLLIDGVVTMVMLPVFIFIAYPIFRGAWIALCNASLTMDSMYALGMSAALAATLGSVAGYFPSQYRFFDAPILLGTFLTIGRYLENNARNRTSGAIESLIKLQPVIAHLERDGDEVDIPLGELKKHDRFHVYPNEKIPTDGVIIHGSSYIDESMVTGEALPVLKKMEDSVIGGTINRNGLLIVEALKLGEETMLRQIIRLVSEAQGSRLPLQRVADKWVGRFIPIILGCAVITFIIWIWFVQATMIVAFTTTLAVLMVACPCALGLATPTAITVGLGRAANFGILIRNGEVIEWAERVSIIVFDKTGTLTLGKPEVRNLIALDIDENRLLQVSASLEKYAGHPLGDAVVQKSIELNLPRLPVEHPQVFEGKGISGTVDGSQVVIGNRRLMAEKKIEYAGFEDRISHFEQDGKTTLLVAIEQRLVGIISIADTLRENAKPMIAALKSLGYKTMILTGDHELAARSIAHVLGIDQVSAELLPGEKQAALRDLMNRGEIVAFVGDGINDAPALATAQVGIALGSGTDVAMESGDIVLIRDDLMSLPRLFRLVNRLMSRIRLNLFWAAAYNLVLIPVAAGAFYPLTGITFQPQWAALAMIASSLTVIMLSLQLKRFNPD